MKRITRTGALSAAALVLCGAGGATAASTLTPSSPDNELVHRGCVIRFDTKTSAGTTKPHIHANSAHRCVGLRSEPTVDSTGRLVLKTDGGEPIVTMSASPDETFAARGITCGVSGGTGTTRVSCYDRAGKPVRADSPQLFGSTSNLWMSWTSWSG